MATPARGTRARTPLTDRELASLVREAQRRGLISLPTDDRWDDLVADVRARVEGGLCGKQLGFLNDPARWVAACAGRQSGKNHTVSRLLVLTALEIPDAECVYVNATFREGRSIMWDSPTDGLATVLRDLGLREGIRRGGDFDLNHSLLRVTFRNGSYVQVLGADRGAWARLRGNRYDLIVIDEAQKLEAHGFERALRDDLPGTIAAKAGRLVLIGMPNEFATGVFHDVTERAIDPDTGRILWPQFSLHHWDAEDNDLRPDIWANIVRDRDAAGLDEDDPSFVREFRARWIRIDGSFVLPLGPHSLWDGLLPERIPATDGTLVPRSQPLTVYAGIDWGWTDAFAVVIVSVSREEGVIREVHTEKHTQMLIDAKAQLLKDLRTRYNIARFYADNASPGDIEYCRQKFGLPVVPADKSTSTTQGQAFFVSCMRARLANGQLRIRDGSALHREVRVLTPDPKEWANQRIKTVPGSEDHAYDAFRYVFRGIWTNHVQQPEPPMTPTQAREAELREMALRAGQPRPDGRHRTAGHGRR